jgi:hypothetical protein
MNLQCVGLFLFPAMVMDQLYLGPVLNGLFDQRLLVSIDVGRVWVWMELDVPI